MTSNPAPLKEPLRLVYVDPADLKDNPRNWRTHPSTQVNALEGLIGEVGWAGALLYNERTERLIDGHARKKSFAGKGPVPVLVGSWSEADEQKILASLDPLAAMATTNRDALESLLRDVQTGNEGLAAMLAELAQKNGIIPAVTPGGGGDEFDTTAAESGPTRTNVGELWVIGGKHQLLIANSTDKTQLMRLGLSIGSVTILDPPYEAPESLWLRFLKDPTILFGQGKHLRAVPQRLYRFERIIDKVTAHRSATVKILHRHAFVVQCGSDKTLPKRGSFDSIVTSEARPNHPHEKCVSLIVEHLESWTPPGDVFDPFAGSGASLIAAHRTGRSWFGCELNPFFADVILRRAESEGLKVEKESAIKAGRSARTLRQP